MKTSGILAAVTALAAAVLIAGCASPTSGGASPASTPQQTATDVPGPFSLEPMAQWIDGGSGVVVVTWGSGSCIPESTDGTAEGQEIEATLTTPTGPCSADLRSRGTYVGVPSDTDRTKQATLSVSVDGDVLELDVAPLTAPGEASTELPAAVWLPNGEVAVMVWSTTRPSVSAIMSESATVLQASVQIPEDEATDRAKTRWILLLGSSVLETGGALVLWGVPGMIDYIDVPIAGERPALPDDEPTEVRTHDDAGWIEGGTGIALIWWGSRYAIPSVTDVAADGQHLTVTVDQPTAGTEDLYGSGSYISVPESVDRTRPVTITVVGRDASFEVAPLIDPVAVAAESPSAVWMPTGVVALLTYGSGCRPEIIESDERSASEYAVTLDLVPHDAACRAILTQHITVLVPTVLAAGGHIALTDETNGGDTVEVAVTGEAPRR